MTWILTFRSFITTKRRRCHFIQHRFLLDLGCSNISGCPARPLLFVDDSILGWLEGRLIGCSCENSLRWLSLFDLVLSLIWLIFLRLSLTSHLDEWVLSLLVFDWRGFYNGEATFSLNLVHYHSLIILKETPRALWILPPPLSNKNPLLFSINSILSFLPLCILPSTRFSQPYSSLSDRKTIFLNLF